MPGPNIYSLSLQLYELLRGLRDQHGEDGVITALESAIKAAAPHDPGWALAVIALHGGRHIARHPVAALTSLAMAVNMTQTDGLAAHTVDGYKAPVARSGWEGETAYALIVTSGIGFSITRGDGVATRMINGHPVGEDHPLVILLGRNFDRAGAYARQKVQMHGR